MSTLTENPALVASDRETRSLNDCITITLEALAESCGGYWAEHANSTQADWKIEVAGGDTLLGYWEWVARREGIATRTEIVTDPA